jgi:hypothetical protein
MNRLIALRPTARIVFAVTYLALVLVLNVYLTVAMGATSSVFLSLLLPATNLLNEFSPDILATVRRRFGPSAYASMIRDYQRDLRAFLTDCFQVTFPEERSYHDLPTLFSALEATIADIPGTPLARSQQPDTRRRPISLLLFVISKIDDSRLLQYDSPHNYIKARYRELSDRGKAELYAAYSQVVLAHRRYVNPEQYFQLASPQDEEHARLHFLDRFLKDDYITEVAERLRLKEAQIETFKSSLEAVAKSGRLNLDHLRRFVRTRGEYRKLFIVASETKLPKPIQSYITQNPHFILKPSSVANLPRIGLSSRFDIFFFSPRVLLTSAGAAIHHFAGIDPTVLEHPVKVYEVDPIESSSTGLQRASQFAQAISFFEDSTIDTSQIADLSYQQILSVLEHSNVSLKDLLRGIPISEFSSTIELEEKATIDQLFSRAVAVDGTSDVFRAPPNARTILSRVSRLRTIPVHYSIETRRTVFNNRVTLSKSKARLRLLVREILANLEALNQNLP